MHHSAFSNEIRQNLPPPPPPPPPNPYVAEIHNIPRNNISDFLTKIAHGEKLDIQGFIDGGRTNNGGGDSGSKRRRLDSRSPELLHHHHYTAAHRPLPAMTPPYTPNMIDRRPMTPPFPAAPPPPPPPPIAPRRDSWPYQPEGNTSSYSHSQVPLPTVTYRTYLSRFFSYPLRAVPHFLLCSKEMS